MEALYTLGLSATERPTERIDLAYRRSWRKFGLGSKAEETENDNQRKRQEFGDRLVESRDFLKRYRRSNLEEYLVVLPTDPDYPKLKLPSQEKILSRTESGRKGDSPKKKLTLQLRSQI